MIKEWTAKQPSDSIPVFWVAWLTKGRAVIAAALVVIGTNIIHGGVNRLVDNATEHYWKMYVAGIEQKCVPIGDTRITDYMFRDWDND
jgi:hypothetical protein